MGLLNVIRVQLDRFSNEEIGIVASNLYRLYEATLQDWIWVVDVELEQVQTNPNATALEVLKAVPVDDPSRQVFRADIGTQVKLARRPQDNRWVVTGLAKFAPGTVTVSLVRLTGCQDGISEIGLPQTFGSQIRRLTYDELGDAALHGFPYGELPYGASGKFDQDGNLIKLIPGG